MGVRRLIVYNPRHAPRSKSEEALNLLASWTATLDEAEPANLTDR